MLCTFDVEMMLGNCGEVNFGHGIYSELKIAQKFEAQTNISSKEGYDSGSIDMEKQPT